MKNIYLILGCSGSGKSTISKLLEEKYHLISVQSYTTRKQEPRDNGDNTHIFVTQQEFAEIPNIVGYTQYQGNEYGATIEQVESADLYVINPDGLEFFRKHYKGNKGYKIIYIDSDLNVRYERMVKRAEEKGDIFLNAVDKALNRIKNDVVEFYDYTHNNAHVDFVVRNNKNDNLNQVVDKIYDYICDCEREVR